MDPRRIDALVAEHVMGWTNNRDDPTKSGMWGINDWLDETTPVLMPDFPSYSTDIAAAWEVLEELIPKYLLSLSWVDGWEVSHYEANEQVTYHLAEDASAPLAICLAALKAKGVSV